MPVSIEGSIIKLQREIEDMESRLEWARGRVARLEREQAAEAARKVREHEAA